MALGKLDLNGTKKERAKERKERKEKRIKEIMEEEMRRQAKIWSMLTTF